MHRVLRGIAAITLLSVGAPALAACGDAVGCGAIAESPRLREGIVDAVCGGLRYDNQRLEWVSPGGRTTLWAGLRFQTRHDTDNGNLVTVDDLVDGGEEFFDIRRGRLKGGASLWQDRLDLYTEYDWRSDTLLDYRATAIHGGWLSLRVGQWKSDYNRERVDSSGKQQLTERSLSNFWFTVDRQPGVVVSARLAEGSRLDSKVWGGYLSGQGRGGGFASGDGLALGRWQWNPAGELLPFSQSDLKRRESPVPSVALATVVGRTPFTRFSSSGGGNLPGLAAGDYNLRQFLIETAWHYRGIAWQQELHWKDLDDRATGQTTRLIGGYAQLGAFPSEWCNGVPRPLELVARVSLVDPGRSVDRNTLREWTLGANWFFAGHRNKLTADVSWLNFDAQARDASLTRFRLQWELSI